MRTADTVAVIVLRGESVLVERRSWSKATDPGVVVVPGGHVEPGESFEEACRRERWEELGLECERFEFFDCMRWETPIEVQNVHYYVCRGWTGKPKSVEADEVFFIGFDELDGIDIVEERLIIEKLVFS